MANIPLNPAFSLTLNSYRAGAKTARPKNNNGDNSSGSSTSTIQERAWAQTPAVEFTLSPEARRAAKNTGPPTSVSPHPDPVLQLRQTETQLRQVPAELGMPISTNVRFQVPHSEFTIETKDVRVT